MSALINCHLFVFQSNKNKEYNSIDDPGIDFEFVYEVYEALLESVSLISLIIPLKLLSL